MGKPAVFLDRDGVINSYVYNSELGIVDSPSCPDEFQLIHGVQQAVEDFHAMGVTLIVVSNQPGIAKGHFSKALLDAMTTKMLMLLNEHVDGVYYCMHHPGGLLDEYRQNCSCRKPKPGLLLQAAQDLHLDLKRSVMIGDSLTDIVAGQKAGTRTIFVNPRKCYLCDEIARQKIKPDVWVTSLADSVGVVESFLHEEIPSLGGGVEDELHI